MVREVIKLKSSWVILGIWIIILIVITLINANL